MFTALNATFAGSRFIGEARRCQMTAHQNSKNHMYHIYLYNAMSKTCIFSKLKINPNCLHNYFKYFYLYLQTQLTNRLALIRVFCHKYLLLLNTTFEYIDVLNNKSFNSFLYWWIKTTYFKTVPGVWIMLLFCGQIMYCDKRGKPLSEDRSSNKVTVIEYTV